jgi:hypothetical protein
VTKHAFEIFDDAKNVKMIFFVANWNNKILSYHFRKENHAYGNDLHGNPII